ncbi:MAG TPA: glycerol-3-phosphate acyltransferase [Thermoanaerobaculia bacterium]
MLPVAVILSAYLIGSIPFSYLVVRLVTGADFGHMGRGTSGRRG